MFPLNSFGIDSCSERYFFSFSPYTLVEDIVINLLYETSLVRLKIFFDDLIRKNDAYNLSLEQYYNLFQTDKKIIG